VLHKTLRKASQQPFNLVITEEAQIASMFSDYNLCFGKRSELSKIWLLATGKRKTLKSRKYQTVGGDVREIVLFWI
jgi:hypothetical protein